MKEVEDMKGHPIIRQIVGRCHVGESYCAVLRYAISRMDSRMLRNEHTRGYDLWRALPKPTRRGVWNEIVRVHNENRNLYRTVMSGRF